MTATIHKFPDIKPLTPTEVLERIAEENPNNLFALTREKNGQINVWSSCMTAPELLMALEIVKRGLVDGEILPDDEEPEE